MTNELFLFQFRQWIKDLRKIADSFVKTLTGTFHHRIQYPGMAIPRPGADARPPDQPSTALSR